jgi:hypothetical protein
MYNPIVSAVKTGTGDVNGCRSPRICMDYNLMWGGTSHCAPLVSGTAALILSLKPELNWLQVRNILRSTAVKIDFRNTDPNGIWVDRDGDGITEFSNFYGYGRVDVLGALQLANDTSTTQDLVIRDNLTDNGTIPSSGWHAASPDIWVRRNDEPIPILDYMSEPPHEDPVRTQDNFIFCRIKNFGSQKSLRCYVRILVTHFPGMEFSYPRDFMPTNSPSAPLPSPLVPSTYLIAESNVDEILPGDHRIIKIRWPSELIPSDTVSVDGITVRWHPCLLADISPHDGPAPVGTAFDIKKYNNLAQRNLTILDRTAMAHPMFSVIVIGTHSNSIMSIYIDGTSLIKPVQLQLSALDDSLMDQLLMAKISNNKIKSSSNNYQRNVTQGIQQKNRTLLIEVSKEIIEIPVQLSAGKFMPLLVGVRTIKHSTPYKQEKILITQKRNDGVLSAGYLISIAA